MVARKNANAILLQNFMLFLEGKKRATGLAWLNIEPGAIWPGAAVWGDVRTGRLSYKP